MYDVFLLHGVMPLFVPKMHCLRPSDSTFGLRLWWGLMPLFVVGNSDSGGRPIGVGFEGPGPLWIGVANQGAKAQAEVSGVCGHPGESPG